MTITTQTAVSVGAAVMDAVPVGIARDFLAGYTGDYYFFQYSQAGALTADEYILITGTDLSIDDETGDILTGDEFTVFDITALSQVSMSSHTDSFSGTIIGIDSGAAVENFNGSYTRQESKNVQQWLTQIYTVDHQISISNSITGSDSQFLVYSSMDQYAHLVAGGEYYGFAQTVILLGCIGYFLIHGIFKHISN